jgi:hypothetical protein
MCYSPVSYWSGSEEEEERTELGYEEKDDIEEDKVKHVCSSLCWSLQTTRCAYQHTPQHVRYMAHGPNSLQG